MAALFAVDDYYCDDERTGSDPVLIGPRLTLAQVALDPAYLVADYAAELDGGLTTDPVLVALRSYLDRVAHVATPAQVARVRHETVAMFVTMSGEAGWRAVFQPRMKAAVPSLNRSVACGSWRRVTSRGVTRMSIRWRMKRSACRADGELMSDRVAVGSRVRPPASATNSVHTQVSPRRARPARSGRP
jgi:hypothetical protein